MEGQGAVGSHTRNNRYARNYGQRDDQPNTQIKKPHMTASSAPGKLSPDPTSWCLLLYTNPCRPSHLAVSLYIGHNIYIYMLTSWIARTGVCSMIARRIRHFLSSARSTIAGKSDALNSCTPITPFTACNPEIMFSRTYFEGHRSHEEALSLRAGRSSRGSCCDGECTQNIPDKKYCFTKFSLVGHTHVLQLSSRFLRIQEGMKVVLGHPIRCKEPP